MSEQYPGGYISKTPPTPTATTAPGVWSLSQAAALKKQGVWPTSPGAPTIGTATAGGASASVAFTAPTDTGSSAITSYTATSSPDNISASGATSPITVTGLTVGTSYTFTVKATNGAGTGPASSASNSVVPFTPNYEWINTLSQSSANVANYSVPSMAVDSSGNTYVAGRYDASGYDRGYLAKYDNTGTLVWQKGFYAVSNDGASAFGVAASSDGTRVAVCIQRYVSPTTYGQIILFDSSGSRLWTVQISAPTSNSNIYSAGVAFDSSNNVYFTCAYDQQYYYRKGTVVKLDASTGATVWNKYLEGNNNTEPKYLFCDAADKIYICGESQTGFMGVLDTSGNFLVNGGPDIKFVSCMSSDSSGNIYVLAGSAYNEPVEVHKLDSSGSAIWKRKLSTTVSQQIEPGQISVDGNNDVYVTIRNTGTYASSYVAKYNSSGSLQWRKKFSVSGGYQPTFSSALISRGSDLSFYVGLVTGNGSYNSSTYLKLPKDGTKTGTYANGPITLIYADTTEIADSASTLSYHGSQNSGDRSVNNSTVSTTVFTSPMTVNRTAI